jgi:hypothetical protein
MQGRILLFKPAVVPSRETPYLGAPGRRLPMLLNSQGYTDTVRVKLPQGFKVDEKPAPVTLDTVFGKYRMSCDVKDGELLFVRSLEVRAATIAPAEYKKVRDFYGRVLAADQSPVVLVKE